MSALSFRRWLAQHSSIAASRPDTPLDEDWYSSADTRRVAQQLNLPHQLVVGWASEQHAPTAEQAAALEALGGPPASSWAAVEEPATAARGAAASRGADRRPADRRSADRRSAEEVLDRQHLQERCACAAHQLIRAASDYELLPVSSRRQLLRKVIATSETTEAACSYRQAVGGAHELEDVRYVVLDRPDAVPFEVWEAEAWARVEGLPSTFGPHRLGEYLAREERSLSWFAKHVGESDAVVQGLATGRSRSVSVQLAFWVQEAGGPCYVNWLRVDEDERRSHRARPALVWDTSFVAQPVPRSFAAQSAERRSAMPEVYASRGMHHLRRWMTVQKVTQTDLARACGTTRHKLVSWVCGAALPTLEEAWGIYRAGGPPVYSWLHDPVLYAQRPVTDSSHLEQRLERVRGTDPSVAERARVERYKEQARWAVSRPVSGAGPKPSGEALDAAYDVYRRRCEAARALLRAGSEGLAETLSVWETEWAVEYVGGQWVAPWERMG
jgi:transcriptional regulator with XRE-family HTH domain